MERYTSIINGDITPLKENVLVSDLEIGEKITSSGLIILDDDGTDRGIRPRWCKVYSVGSKVTEVTKGDWVLVEHGRWTRGVKLKKNDGTSSIIRMINRKDILLVSDEKPI